MPTIQPAELWRESARYEDYGKEMLRITDRHGVEMLYGPTNEELITAIVRDNIRSYRDLPKNLYHIQWKFRDEVRPRFGVMRGREFLMKDAYSFDIDEAGARRAYYKMFVAYLRSFARMGLQAIPMRADTGPIGGDLSHEFIVLAETGESAVFCDRAWLDSDVLAHQVSYQDDLAPFFEKWTSLYAATEEIHKPDACPVPADRLVAARGIEVGQIFFFGTKYSAPMKATVTGPDGKETPLVMGSYGIGVSRLVGAIIEASHDETRDHLARSGGAIPPVAHQFEDQRRHGTPGGRCALCRFDRCRDRRAVRRSRCCCRSEVRRCRFDRPAPSGDHRPARCDQRHSGDQEPQDRGAQRTRDRGCGGTVPVLIR